ncbi:MAG: hypothetical protein ACOZAR_01085 [Patescibacteria group bacterium]
MSTNVQIESVKKLLEIASANLKNAQSILSELEGGEIQSIREAKANIEPLENNIPISDQSLAKIIEGVFDGQTMIDAEGKKYPVPANYASKSKLVAGDILKLTIMPDGKFIYKQIGPVDRKSVIGMLQQDGIHFFVMANGKKYNVLLASVTYFKANPGNEVTIIIPANEDSDWACIENVLN